MKKCVACFVLVLAGLGALRVAMGGAGVALPRALVVSDLGTGQKTTVARMEAHGWTVGTITALELLEASGSELRAQWGVIWILPGSDYDLIRPLVESGGAGGPLEAFLEAGGVVVMVGLGDTQFRIDLAPGGLDSESQENAGPTTIAEPNHPFIAGSKLGGTDLTSADLDPNGTGGDGCLLNPPPDSNVVDIAVNSYGTNLCEYQLGTGRVLVSRLDLLSEACLENLLLYLEQIVKP
ncbi:MAG: hypothetical protein V3W34_17315 [Phycisphaerae bacterium]